MQVFLFEEESDMVQDREDLLSILRMRFGEVDPEVVENVYALKDLNTIERLILVAANAPTFNVFLEELQEEGSFRIVGERFNPLSTFKEGGM
jgi:hypothetical protein